jgi:hypothetical protein
MSKATPRIDTRIDIEDLVPGDMFVQGRQTAREPTGTKNKRRIFAVYTILAKYTHAGGTSVHYLYQSYDMPAPRMFVARADDYNKNAGRRSLFLGLTVRDGDMAFNARGEQR